MAFLKDKASRMTGYRRGLSPVQQKYSPGEPLLVTFVLSRCFSVLVSFHIDKFKCSDRIERLLERFSLSADRTTSIYGERQGVSLPIRISAIVCFDCEQYCVAILFNCLGIRIETQAESA